MDIYFLVYHIKTEDIYTDIDGDVKERFDTSEFMKPRPFTNNKVIGLMKDELGGKMMTQFVAMRPKFVAMRRVGIRNVKESRNAL